MTAARAWLIDRWQWPAAALFTAIVLLVLLPVWYVDAGPVMTGVVLMLPLYMLHQYEEHRDNRFVMYANRVLGGGLEVLTPVSAFIINSAGVWGVIIVGIALARFAAPGYGTIAVDLALVNALAHIQSAVTRREYNPGLWTALALFLPFGGLAYALILIAGGATLVQQAVGLAVAVAVHVWIIALVAQRKRMLSGVSVPAA